MGYGGLSNTAGANNPGLVRVGRGVLVHRFVRTSGLICLARFWKPRAASLQKNNKNISFSRLPKQGVCMRISMLLVGVAALCAFARANLGIEGHR
jgi:hypothetical protein